MEHYNEFLERLGKPGEFRRNHYYYGRLLDEDAFLKEQAYSIRKRWLLNRLSLGFGVLAGLRVQAKDGQVCILPGVALDSFGREIVVPQQVCLDPWQLTGPDGKPGERLDPDAGQVRVAICVAYQECAADFAPVMVDECGTEEQCAPNSIVEGFKVFVLRADSLPALEPQDPAVCQALTGGGANRTNEERKQELCLLLDTVFPQAAEAGCVWLAEVTLQPGPLIANIDCCARRAVIYSNAELFEMILCLADRLEECCGPQPTPTPTPEPTPTPPPTPTPTPTPTPPPTTTPTPTPPPTLPPTPPPAETLRIMAIEFVNRSGTTSQKVSPEAVLDQVKFFLQGADDYNSIHFIFNHPVDPSSFRVASSGLPVNRSSFSLFSQARREFIDGQIIPDTTDPRQITYRLTGPIQVFVSGSYDLVLIGDQTLRGRPPIRGMQGTGTQGERLDGEPTPLGLPTGDGIEGGNFAFRFDA